MQRTHFKEMYAPLIIDGFKTATTRDHTKKLGLSEAVKGSRYKPIVFATIMFTEILQKSWQDVITNHYKEEGFESAQAMQDSIVEEKIITKDTDMWKVDKYFHRFIRVVDEITK